MPKQDQMTINEVSFSAPIIKRITDEKRHELRSMLLKTLKHFPELEGDTVHVGLTRAFGFAAFACTGETERIKIRYNPVSELTYNLLGHELTHFVQRLGIVPHGEVPCDIWNIARHELFTDQAPYYIDLPHAIRNDWGHYAGAVRDLCIKAIQERERGRRRYMVWLTKELRELNTIEQRNKTHQSNS